jgi:prepilin-type N-terminal cleavage/methylation domain-containing protein
MARRSRGFTLIEMLMVLVVAALLAGLGLLKYIDMRATARTTSLAGDVRAIQAAAFAYFADFEQFPPDAAAGAVPTGLAPYLPGGLSTSFNRTFYVLDYQHFAFGFQPPLVGVAVTTTDAKLLAKLIATFAGRGPFYMVGGQLTYLIAGPSI